MDFSNEPYVRLYTRDTTNWRRLGWHGQSVLMALLRKVDRSGAIDIEDLEPWEAVMLHVSCPEEAAREGVAAMLRTGAVEIRGNLLVFPNHIEAQEAVKSDKLRQRESRERRALGIGQTVTKRDQSSQGVTPESQAVTVVTNGHSLLCSAVPTSALPTPSGDAEGGGDADLKQAEPTRPEFRDATPERPMSAGAQQEVLDAFRQAYPGTMPRLYGQPLREAVEHCRDLARDYRKPLHDVALAVCVAAAPGTTHWHLDLAKVDPWAPTVASAGRKTGNFTAPAPASAFTGVEVHPDDLFGPLLPTKPKEAARGR